MWDNPQALTSDNKTMCYENPRISNPGSELSADTWRKLKDSATKNTCIELHYLNEIEKNILRFFQFWLEDVFSMEKRGEVNVEKSILIKRLSL